MGKSVERQSVMPRSLPLLAFHYSGANHETLRRFAIIFVVIGGLGLAPAVTEASLIVYFSRATFNAENPELLVEDFEEAAVAPVAFQLMTGPLDGSTNNGIFSPGNILPGLAIQDRPGPSLSGLNVLGSGVLPGVTKTILASTFADSMDLLFSGGATAVGFDFGASSGPGAILSSTVVVTIFGAGDVLLGTTNVNTLGGVPFLGVASTEAITRVNLSTSTSEFVDNVAFGAASVPEPSAVLLTLVGLTIPGWRAMRWRAPQHPASEPN
jgi:hypothetical protein